MNNLCLRNTTLLVGVILGASFYLFLGDDQAVAGAGAQLLYGSKSAGVMVRAPNALTTNAPVPSATLPADCDTARLNPFGVVPLSSCAAIPAVPLPTADRGDWDVAEFIKITDLNARVMGGAHEGAAALLEYSRGCGPATISTLLPNTSPCKLALTSRPAALALLEASAKAGIADAQVNLANFLNAEDSMAYDRAMATGQPAERPQAERAEQLLMQALNGGSETAGAMVRARARAQDLFATTDSALGGLSKDMLRQGDRPMPTATDGTSQLK